MSPILQALRSAPAWGSIPVTDYLRCDVAWFRQYTAMCNARLLIKPDLLLYRIQCDACPSGGGGFSQNHFFSATYPPELADEYHISQIEALNILVALKTLLPPDLKHVEVVIVTDNMAAMHTLNSGKTKDHILAACSRELWLLVAVRELKIMVPRGTRWSSPMPLAGVGRHASMKIV